MPGFNMKKNKAGSAIAEAAIVFPVIIMSIIAVIYIYLYLYDQLSSQVKMHCVLRTESGVICGNMFTDNLYEELAVYRKGGRIYCYSDISIEAGGLLKGAERQIYAEKYLIDETRVVRAADLVKDGINDEEQ